MHEIVLMNRINSSNFNFKIGVIKNTLFKCGDDVSLRCIFIICN